MGFIVHSLFICLALLVVGCQKPAGQPESVKSALHSIGGVDVQLDHYPSYAEYDKSVYGQLKVIVEKVPSATELKMLFVECHRLWKMAPEAPQEHLQWVDSYCESRNAIIYRLGEMKSEEAAKVLVELFADDTFGWDGGFSLDVCNAITRCGKLALPHLAKLDSGERKERVQQLMSLIEKGKLYL